VGAPTLEDSAQWGTGSVLSSILKEHFVPGSPNVVLIQNQSLRYAIHQLRTNIGMVAPPPHQKGKTKSATKLKVRAKSQNILRCMAEL
jgi:hypothetical protein